MSSTVPHFDGRIAAGVLAARRVDRCSFVHRRMVEPLRSQDGRLRQLIHDDDRASVFDSQVGRTPSDVDAPALEGPMFVGPGPRVLGEALLWSLRAVLDSRD